MKMVVLPIKRERESDLDTITTMANYLMLLSRQANHFDTLNNSPNRVFECKTCNRQFSSFQALGGHRASHKKPRLMGELNFHQLSTSPPKPKTHECSICGLEFPIGQALGGHMRRHRAMLNENNIQVSHVVKKSNSPRVLCLDLNLTPLENDLEFKLGKSSPVVDCFL
ncbi:PREDICTED: zinc finger protein ZAT11-like [Nicotiana attenuata]|uniref:Zinc finger protein zat11 n=1 Tax=Nicotiana attenuata TaxID=49451 RepID=A0A1J6JNM6_NICAT|nr:PREDICTED: zinc finger protein ZAT11-like [Nicotiana attenuata]OIT19402.1 zinc finger protein zat11 [Nicotiana attenuata]